VTTNEGRLETQQGKSEVRSVGHWNEHNGTRHYAAEKKEAKNRRRKRVGEWGKMTVEEKQRKTKIKRGGKKGAPLTKGGGWGKN